MKNWRAIIVSCIISLFIGGMGGVSDAQQGGFKWLSQRVVDFQEHKINSGTTYTILDSDTDISTGDSPNFLSICFDTPNVTDQWVHLTPAVYASGDVVFELYENPPTVTGGSTPTELNRNRNSADGSAVTTPLTDITALLVADRVVEATATVCADGSPNLVVTTTQDPHALVAGDPVTFTAGTVCAPLVSGTEYFVEEALSTITFTVALTKGGAPIAYGVTTGTAFTTTETGGTTLFTKYYGSGNNNSGQDKWVLKENETYCLKATTEAANIEIDIAANFSIHTNSN